MRIKRPYSLRFLTLTDTSEEYVSIVIKSQELVDKINLMVIENKNSNPIYITVSGVKTSDFKSWGRGTADDKALVSFGEIAMDFGCMDIINDTTLVWGPPDGKWSTTALVYMKTGLKFMIKKSLKNKQITLSCNFIELKVSTKGVMNRVEEILSMNVPYIDLTLSGAKTSDFVAICSYEDNEGNIEYFNFGEECHLGRLEIIDDITLRWYPINDNWDIVALAIAQRGMTFLAYSTLEGKTVTLS